MAITSPAAAEKSANSLPRQRSVLPHMYFWLLHLFFYCHNLVLWQWNKVATNINVVAICILYYHKKEGVLAMELICGNIYRLLHRSGILLQNLCYIATKKALVPTKINCGDIPGLLPQNVMSLH